MDHLSEAFFDYEYFWNSQDGPRFTERCRNTILIWVPISFLLLTVIHHLIIIKGFQSLSSRKISWNRFNTFRMFICCSVIVIKLIETIRDIFPSVQASLSELDTHNISFDTSNSFNSSIIQLISYIILSLIYIFERKSGLHTNRFVWFYLLSLIICESFRYHAIMTYADRNSSSILYERYESCHYPLVIMLFLLECYGDKPNYVDGASTLRNTSNSKHQSMGKNQKYVIKSSEIEASFCSRITFQWFGKIIWLGYKNRICWFENLSQWTSVEDQTSLLTARLIDCWYKKETRENFADSRTFQSSDGCFYKKNNIFFVIARLYWPRLLKAALLRLIHDCLLLSGPIILKFLIRFMSTPSNDIEESSPQWHGLLFASLFLVIPTLQSFFVGNYFYNMQVMGLHIKSMLTGSIYRKSYLLSNDSRQQSTCGEMINLMAIDTRHFQDLLQHINLLWSAPLQFTLAIVLLYQQLGLAIFAGVAAMLILLPVILLIARCIKVSQLTMMGVKDERIKQVNEILSGIRVIKLYAWENSFIQNVLSLRSKELEYLAKIYNLDACQMFLWNAAPLIVAVLSFGVYILANEENTLDAEKAFVSLSLFAILKFPLTQLPNLVNSLLLTLVSAKRINKFLNSNELFRYVTPIENKKNARDNLEISIKDGCLTWNLDQGKVTLSNINLQVERGSFVAVVGQVGSGKSSLISGLLGDMRYISGEFKVNNGTRIAYVPQEAWIQNMSLRNNIVFGNDFKPHLYNRVLDACSLLTDLQYLPGQDEAEIGEKGINLSGGQKQRVSLARACYASADLYLIDDPLSALDSHVAKHVFEKVLSSKTGLLKKKTRLLATNNLFVLPHVDHILVMQKGEIVESGSYDELMQTNTSLLGDLMRQYSINQLDAVQAPRDLSDHLVQQGKTSLGLAEGMLQSKEKSTIKIIDGKKTDQDNNQPTVGKLINSERMETGKVKTNVYHVYFQAITFKFLISFFVLMILASTFNVGTSIWLSIWSEDAKNLLLSRDPSQRTMRISGYAFLAGLNCLMTILATLTLAQGIVRASRQMHSRILQGVFHSPMVFFDTTPLGRITNRFAKDIDIIDSSLPSSLRQYIVLALQVLTSLILVFVTYPMLLIVLIPLAMLYYFVQKIFIVTTRQLKRLESTTRSPIFSNFSETICGISSIKAYNCIKRFVRHSDDLVDLNNSCSLMIVIANRWLMLRLEFIGNLITTLVALFSVLSKGSISAGLAGLVVSYSANVAQYLGMGVRWSSDLETNIVSVERIMEYWRNEQEDEWIKKNSRPKDGWPQHGHVSISNFSARYRKDTPIVLSDITVNIEPGEKIGILGRTGSGKSSLSLALFRILEASSGKICIDGEDIAQFGLHDVRSRLTIIPQDPVLFSGTVRFNLDPLELYSDIEIWNAIGMAHLSNHIKSLGSGLDSKVSEFGNNFSVGQKQLICLARAILRRSKILVLDEATASVDIETDSLVQKTIRNVFSDCTIMTIAHRIHTILDSNRIIILDQGVVIEFDKLVKLMDNPESAFMSLLEDAGMDKTNILLGLYKI